MRGHQFADRYRLDDLLGRGGMAEVWRGRDLRLERAVAVKILDQFGSADPDAMERFRREAVAVARLAHPNIVAGYDFGAEDGRPYLVMELVEGRSLETMLQDGRLPIPEAMGIAAQACSALHAAHSAGIVHRDIKPGNLVVTADGTVKVLDFGIALLQDAANQASLTRAATVVGTSHYMAPEQASGGSADARTDLYALGCVLHAMLTGQPPFNGESAMAVLYQHLHHAPTPARKLRPDTPPALQTLLDSLLAKDPGQRPASAAAVRSTLTELAESGFAPGADAAAPATAGQPDAAASNEPGGTSVMLVGRAAVPPPAAPTTSTDHFPQQFTGPRRASIGSRGAVIGASVAAVLVLVLIVWALLPDGGQPTANPPSASPEPSSAAPSSPDSTEPTATTPAGRLIELRELLNRLAEAGQIDPETALRLEEQIDEIGKEIRKGDFDKASEKLTEAQEELEEAAGENLVEPDAYEQLSGSFNRLAEVLPSSEDDEQGDEQGGGKPGKGRGKGKKDD